MTLEQYLADPRAVNYYQMSQWQRFRDFRHALRTFGISRVPLLVLNPSLHPRYWGFGFESWQTDYRFHIGPLSLIWPYE